MNNCVVIHTFDVSHGQLNPVWHNFIRWLKEYNGGDYTSHRWGISWVQLIDSVLSGYGAVYIPHVIAGNSVVKFNNAELKLAFVLRFA